VGMDAHGIYSQIKSRSRKRQQNEKMASNCDTEPNTSAFSRF